MTDYNDGKWHGWNGGECPVHLKSLVEVRFLADETIPQARIGDDWIWSHDGNCGDIIAFRVVKAYREARECWSYGAHIRNTEAEAIAFRKTVADANPGLGYDDTPIFHWREVLP